VGTEVAGPGRTAGDLPLAVAVEATDAAMSYHTRNNVAISYSNIVNIVSLKSQDPNKKFE
jgi:hypothetical protein